jgi:hypothetical protein
MEAVETYKDVELFGTINLLNEPRLLLTIGSPQEPAYLSEISMDGNNPVSQYFKLENYKIYENISEDMAPLCVSAISNNNSDPTIRLYNCDRENLSRLPPEWNVPDSLMETRWAHDRRWDDH